MSTSAGLGVRLEIGHVLFMDLVGYSKLLLDEQREQLQRLTEIVRKEDALREGRRAVELLPVTRDAMTGAEVLRNLVIICAWAGEKDLALKQLEKLLPINGPISYGQLRLHPWWDPLRDDPRFEKLLEESKKPVPLN